MDTDYFIAPPPPPHPLTMRVLITNDDGPLNDEYSPYIRPFIQHIKRAHPHWEITVCVPHEQRSWTGKAHLAGKDLSASFIYSDIEADDNTFWGPFCQPQQLQTDSSLPYVINPEIPSDAIEWVLIDGTPASCANVALHLLKDKKFDLVISGPNVGRNSSAAYITSSATVGAAMESVICDDVKAVAVSWAYYDNRKIVPAKLMKMASIRSTQIIAHLFENWDPEVDFYSVNVPLVDELSGSTKIFYAPVWENRWTAIFNGPHIREPAGNSQIEDGNESNMITFRWAPDFKNHRNSAHYDVEHDGKIAEGTDMDIIEKRCISVSPLRASFRCIERLTGELKLRSSDSNTPTEIVDPTTQNQQVAALTISKNEYIYQPIKEAVSKYLPGFATQASLPDFSKVTKVFQYGDYEQLDVDALLAHPDKYIANSFIYRKALIRKHYLSHTIHSYIVKHPESILHKAFFESHTLDLDYAEFLDDSLDENWELRQELEREDRWWIVKPSMSDKGQGIRVFKTIEDLQRIFDSFDDEADENEDPNSVTDDTKIIISQLRHFIVQQYMTNPLLLPSMDNKKFHIRCYITCKGDLEVFVYDRMLALFAPTQYDDVTKDEDNFDPIDLNRLQGHLTNTCLQTKNENVQLSVVEFADLSDISQENKDRIIGQIHEIAHDIFHAAVTVNRLNFQPLPNAFETYGVDFLVDDQYDVKLLEVNAYPDFKQTGNELKSLIDELFLNIGKSVIAPLVNGNAAESSTSSVFTKVLSHTSNEW